MDEEQERQDFENAEQLLQLASAARVGDRHALEALVQQTRIGLFAMAYASLRNYDDAHDAVAAALVQVCLHIKTIRQPESVGAWMRSIVRNEVNRIRRNSDRGHGIVALNLSEIDAVDSGFDHVSQLRLDIEQAMRQLSTRQEQAVRLFYFAGMPIQDISVRLQVAPATVRQWLHRGRERLATNLKGYEPVTTNSTDRIPVTPVEAPLSAGIIHSDLSHDLILSLSDALAGGGYKVTLITAVELEPFRENLMGLIQYVTERGKDLLVFDEMIGGRSALEYVINLRGPQSQRTNIPFCVLHAGGRNYFAAAALFAAGVDRVLSKDAPQEISTFAAPFRSRRPIRFLQAFQDATKRASAEAARRGERSIDTRYALWGMLQESPVPLAARPAVEHLAQRLGIPRDQINAALEELFPQPAATFSVGSFLFQRFGIAQKHLIAELENTMAQNSAALPDDEVGLADDLKDAIDVCPEEWESVSSGQEIDGYVRGIGVEHLLLAIIRTRQGLGSQVLAGFSVTLATARVAVRDWIANNWPEAKASESA